MSDSPDPYIRDEPADTPVAGSEPAPPPAPKRSLRERTEELRARAEDAKRSLGTRAEDLRARHESVQVAFAAYERDRRQAGGLLAGGLAFRLFLWLLPMALALVSIVQLVSDASNESPEELADTAGLGAALAATVAQAAEASGGGALWLLILGLGLMLWAAVGMVKALRLLAGVAWQVRPGTLTHSVRSAAIFSGVGLGLMASPVLLGPLYGGGLLSDIAASLLSIAGFTAVFTWAMSVFPRPEGVPWPALLPGALLIAVGIQAIRLVTAIYLVDKLERTNDLYGALGLAVVFLTWLYLIGRLVVGGLALNAELWRARRRAEAANEGQSGPETDT